jgi:cyanophycinase
MLALIGSGEYLPPMEPIDRYLIHLLAQPPRVVCLPTAAGKEGEARLAYWNKLGITHFTRLGVSVEALPVVDRASAVEPHWAGRIRQANFVYLSGGWPDYLYQTLQGSPVWEAILAVHQNGGIVAGCSAGAMIFGARLPGFPRWQPAFDLLDGTIVIPHFEEIPPVMLKLARFLFARNQAVLGIEGNTALVVHHEFCEVVGAGGVTLWNSHQKTRYTHLQRVPCL